MVLGWWNTLPAGQFQTVAPFTARRRSYISCYRSTLSISSQELVNSKHSITSSRSRSNAHQARHCATTAAAQIPDKSIEPSTYNPANTDYPQAATLISSRSSFIPSSSRTTAIISATDTSSSELSGPWLPSEAADDSATDMNMDVNPAAIIQRQTGCPECSGSGRVTCSQCQGTGFLKRGGYNKKNPLNMNRIIGSKWTAMQTTLGWRHFTVTHQRKITKHHTYLLLQASCDHSAQLWVNAQTLRNRSVWAAGWLPMSEIQGLVDEDYVRVLRHKCQSCVGLGFKACQCCDGTGRAQLIVL